METKYHRYEKALDESIYDEETVTSFYEEETIIDEVSEKKGTRASESSYYEEETIAETSEDHKMVNDDQDCNSSIRDCRDLKNGKEKEVESADQNNEEEGFTLTFSQVRISQNRVSDITNDTWSTPRQSISGFHESDDDEESELRHMDQTYCAKFKEGNFRSSLVSQETGTTSSSEPSKLSTRDSTLPSLAEEY